MKENSIEEIKMESIGDYVLNAVKDRLNEVIHAVKKLDKEIKSIKE